MKNEDLRRRQDDERTVLRAVYGEDVEDVRDLQSTRGWKIWKPINVIVHLKPTESASVTHPAYVAIDLHVECLDSYPESSRPKISFDRVVGISTQDLKQLESVLYRKSEENSGIEVILELCQIVQDFLYEHNKPPEGSLHEGMLKQRAENEMKKKRLRVTSEQREKDEIAKEQQIRQEKLMWKEAEKLERHNSYPDGLKDSDEVVLCVDGISRHVKRLNRTLVKREKSDCQCHEWLCKVEDCKALMTEWRFKYLEDRSSGEGRIFNIHSFVKTLSVIEEQLKKLMEYPHTSDTLYRYVLVAIKKNALSISHVDVRIMYAQNIDETDICLVNHPEILDAEPEKWIPSLVAYTVASLQWLHSNRMCHYCLTLNCLWVTYQHTFRVSDFITRYLMKKLRDQFSFCCESSDQVVTMFDEKNPFKCDLIQLAALVEKIVSSNVLPGILMEKHKDFVIRCRSCDSIKDIVGHPLIAFRIQNSTSSSNLATFDAIESDGKQSSSRLINEFVYVDFLGKGGFGDVILARNKLDGNEYAIKRIPLDPQEGNRLNKKMMREAKLFSRLNHPNVVRYYSAWIEMAPNTNSGDEISVKSTTSDIKRTSGPDEDSLMPSRLRDLEARACKNMESMVEWSSSFQKVASSSSSESEPSDEGVVKNPIHTLFSPTIPSQSNCSEFDVLFEGDNDSGESGKPSGGNKSPSERESYSGATSRNAPKRILFIQMEYCENSTLRVLIDSTRLSGNSRMIWRIFREILQGLQYIHQQGMIHRDIKPMNILLDGNNRAKIGDFGLATRDFISRSTTVAALSDATNSSHTKDVGTAMYIAPELLSINVSSSTECTTKIDVYSVGIVLFEMFYRPLLPGMERVMILKQLRNQAVFPPDFANGVPEVHKKAAKELIKMMLKTVPDERPTVQSLIESERIPLVELEESQFQKMFCQTLRTRGSRMYQWMIDTMFTEPITSASDFIFDQAMCTSDRANIARLRASEVMEAVLSKLCSVHAFVPFDTHSLTPYRPSLSHYSSSRLRPCKFIDENGLLVTLPLDLRTNFARYCVRNGINRLKRYTRGKVFYRSDAIGGTHPNERRDFSLDSVGPMTSSNALTADLICLVIEAARTIEVLSTRRWRLCVGHMDLIRGVCFYLGICDTVAQEKIFGVLYALSTTGNIMNRDQKVERLVVGAEISSVHANSLLNFLEPETSSLESLNDCLKPIIRKKISKASELVSNALSDMSDVFAILQSLTGIETNEITCEGTVCYRPVTFSDGLVFHLQVQVTHRRITRRVVLCSGGRFDNVLSKERHVKDPIPPSPLCAVGCSFFIDALAQLHCVTYPGLSFS
ncbi:hypothetical protein AB6A40_005871 [Gnathostoma spinigerum]|uniref:non-specific serine/threonine protein kinase n=1 Tax=Gnathostoma spinigerum TaxID=75299 RepID=A0ABD6ERH4_9BILA